jgi:hypothetical protein
MLSTAACKVPSALRKGRRMVIIGAIHVNDSDRSTSEGSIRGEMGIKDWQWAISWAAEQLK